MGDFLGSYFLDTDEGQLGRDIDLFQEKQPVSVLNFADIEKQRDAPKGEILNIEEDTFPVALCGEKEDEEFCPVTVASMSSLEPSMFSVHLTRKGTQQFKPLTNPEDSEEPKRMKKKIAIGRLRHHVGNVKDELSGTPSVDRRVAGKLVRQALRGFRGMRVTISPSSRTHPKRERDMSSTQ